MPPSFQDTQPAALHQLSGNAQDEFRVGNPTELLALLRQLVDANVRVHLSAPGGSAYTTTLWTVDAHQRRLSLSADAVQPAVRTLIEAGEATAVAYLDSVKLQFDLRNLVLVHGANASAIQAELPEVLWRFQRRASFRVRTPASAAPTATLRHPSLPERLLALRVLDVSVGGCALALPANVPALAAGIQIDGARIELDGDTRFDTTLTLQHVSSGMGSSPIGQRLGCAFGKLDGGAQRALQRYIDQTQKRQRLFSL
ncbi:MAG: flagellar brake protein [Burkholderiaceae bacterium]|nr:flagellar brake protein [Burkholderiaceae bacterium]